MKIFLTGKPRTGKTTICERSFELLKRFGVKVGGVITKEIVKGNRREGFKIINLETGEETLLAHIRGDGPKIGKYRVFVKNIEDYMVPWMLDAFERKEFLIIDEVGPMELLSKEFQRVIDEILQSKKDVLATFHLKKIGMAEKYKPYTLFILDFRNRLEVWEEIRRMLLKYSKERSKGF